MSRLRLFFSTRATILGHFTAKCVTRVLRSAWIFDVATEEIPFFSTLDALTVLVVDVRYQTGKSLERIRRLLLVTWKVYFFFCAELSSLCRVDECWLWKFDFFLCHNVSRVLFLKPTGTKSESSCQVFYNRMTIIALASWLHDAINFNEICICRFWIINHSQLKLPHVDLSRAGDAIIHEFNWTENRFHFWIYFHNQPQSSPIKIKNSWILLIYQIHNLKYFFIAISLMTVKVIDPKMSELDSEEIPQCMLTKWFMRR